MSVSPARACAYKVLQRVLTDNAWADRTLRAEAEGLDPRDRALAQSLVFGSVQWRRTLDHVIDRSSKRSVATLDVEVRAALELGAYQLLMLKGISDYAAVSESVELVKSTPIGLKTSKFVNAVLRGVARDGAQTLAALEDSTWQRAAIRYSVPDWLAEMWFNELGPEQARALLATVNRPAENVIRVNTLKIADVGELAAALPVGTNHAPAWVDAPGLPALPEALMIAKRFDIFGSLQWRRGLITPQSRASMAAARALGPLAGERVLDLCAAPGAKTSHLAALMGGEGELVAVEGNAARARALTRNCQRLGVENVTVINGDARKPVGGDFDRVLLDPPCSGLGTLRGRPDLRWAPNHDDLSVLATLQSELLTAAAAQVKPGGVLVYSVCTLSRVENQDLIDRFLARDPEFELTDSWTLWPQTEGSDGFYIAKLRRSGT